MNFKQKSFSIDTRGRAGPGTLGGGGALRVGQIGWVPHLSAYDPEQESGFWLISRSPPISKCDRVFGNSHVFMYIRMIIFIFKVNL